MSTAGKPLPRVVKVQIWLRQEWLRLCSWQFWVKLLLMGLAMFLHFKSMDAHPLTPAEQDSWWMSLSLGILLVNWWLTMLIHELGHLLAALHFRYRVFHFQVRNLAWQGYGGRSRWYFSDHKQSMVVAFPRNVFRLPDPRKHFWVTFWGPAANGMAALLYLLVYPWLESGLVVKFVGNLAVLNVWVAVGNVLSSRPARYGWDGWLIQRYLQGKDLQPEWVLVQHHGLLAAGEDLRDHPLEPLEEALRAHPEPELKTALLWMLYRGQLRHQRLAAAEATLNLLKDTETDGVMLKAISMEEAYLQARLHHNPVAARALLGPVVPVPPPSDPLPRSAERLKTIWQQRALAAILLAEHQPAEAQLALSQLIWLPFEFPIPAEQHLQEELQQEAEAQLALAS